MDIFLHWDATIYPHKIALDLLRSSCIPAPKGLLDPTVSYEVGTFNLWNKDKNIEMKVFCHKTNRRSK